MKPYKAKSLKAAEKRVRQLQKQISERDKVITIFNRHRTLLARLASETPQFSNPIEVADARQLRDRILSK